MTNAELSTMMETSDEWIVERTGIRERRIAEPGEALSDLALPAAREALEAAGIEAADLGLVIVAPVTPDMAFPATAAIIADQLGAKDAAAYDLSAGCTGFMYAVAQAYGMVAAGLSRGGAGGGGGGGSRLPDWAELAVGVPFGGGGGAGGGGARGAGGG